MKLVRFGVSMEEKLLNEFDYSIKKKGYLNRSEALRDLVRGYLLERGNEDISTPSVGIISYIFDHRHRELGHKLIHIGHDNLGNIVSSLHIHLDTDHCLEVIVAKGSLKELRQLRDEIISSRGVLYGELIHSPQPIKQ
jgi:CopG family nickel-responsive transcriptional regulator